MNANDLERALRATLTGGTALTALLAGTASVYNGVVPMGQAFPAIVYSHQGGGDINESPHRSRNLLYTVKAISAVSMTQAGNIDAAADALLHGKALTVSGWTNYWLMRESDLRLVETTPEGGSYFTSGGVYRIRIAQ